MYPDLAWISIHAPLAGRDTAYCPLVLVVGISIHAPLAGRDGKRYNRSIAGESFQSTRPLRGATVAAGFRELDEDISIHAPLAGRDDADRAAKTLCGISIHAPLAGRDVEPILPRTHENISIHAPLAGRDWWIIILFLFVFIFQSTRPLRGATSELPVIGGQIVISIHAPLAGRDSKSAQKNAALLRK